LASISRKQAKRMAQRNYGETILQIQNEDITRFFDVTAGTDKEIAVGILKKLFKDKFHNSVTFFGTGDSTNDIPMLSLMDIPILVQRQDISWVDYGEIKMENAVDSNSRKGDRS
jgi:mannosyl-3-phosphoglycerate phosphatase